TLGRTAALSLGAIRFGLMGVAAVAGIGVLHGKVQFLSDSIQNLAYVMAGIDTSQITSLVDILAPVNVAGKEMNAFSDDLQGAVTGVKQVSSAIALIAGPLAPLAQSIIQSLDPVNDILGELDDKLTEIAMQ